MESVNRWAIQSNLFDCISIDADIFLRLDLDVNVLTLTVQFSTRY